MGVAQVPSVQHVKYRTSLSPLVPAVGFALELPISLKGYHLLSFSKSENQSQPGLFTLKVDFKDTKEGGVRH